MEPSPTAEATRLTLVGRTSQMAKIPGRLVSNRKRRVRPGPAGRFVIRGADVDACPYEALDFASLVHDDEYLAIEQGADYFRRPSEHDVEFHVGGLVKRGPPSYAPGDAFRVEGVDPFVYPSGEENLWSLR